MCPKTRSWSGNDHVTMLEDTRRSLKNVLEKNNKTIIMGDFNCKEVCWELLSIEGGENSWGNMLLDMTMKHTMTQWVQEKTRFRNNEDPSRLDLVFTKEPDIVNKIKYKTPIGKNYHILLEIELKEKASVERN